MFQFPTVDPIPLPAPVWLFKVLSLVTLLLHFIAVQLLIGGLSLATIWNIFGRKDSSTRNASDSIMRKIPSVMTYVINFGVPPLLFAQVMYGRALYTSSVLIGFYWIMVIVVLTLTYFLLYRSVDRADNGQAWWGYSLISWLGVIYIANVFSTNMTLMLRPEDWQSLYQASHGLGAILPTTDPTTTPRFLFMLAGGFALSGAALVLMSSLGKDSESVSSFLRKWGAGLSAVFFAVQIAAGVWVYSAQPDVVKVGLSASSVYSYSLLAWFAFVLLAILAAAASFFVDSAKAKLTGAASVLCGVLATGAMILVRDGIRDITLLSKGFDVWQRTVVSNWSVVLLFLGLFVGGLVLIGVVLVAVARSAKTLAMQKAVGPSGEFSSVSVLENADD